LSRPHPNLPPVDSELFRRSCSQFATGLAVATVRTADGTPHGLTVNSFTAVSLKPPLILICIDEKSQAIEHFRRAAFFAVNVLAAGQESLAETFARRIDNRFEDQPWTEGSTGAPLIPDALANMECRIVDVLTLGDHSVLVGEMVAASMTEAAPLLYFRGEIGARL